MNAHNSDFGADSALSPMVITFAATSPVEGMREHIGKRWTAKANGPSPRASSARSFSSSVSRARGSTKSSPRSRPASPRGGSAIIAGAPKNVLNLTQMVSREGENFIDAPTRFMIADMDGVQPGFEQDFSTPEAFTSGEIVAAIRSRLRAAGVHSLADAKMVVIATSSTGFPVNAKGEPANGEGRVRVLFETNEPTTLAQQKALMDAVARLPGFSSPAPTRRSIRPSISSSSSAPSCRRE